MAATTAALAGDGDLDDPAYAEAVGQLGPAGLFELPTLVGYYAPSPSSSASSASPPPPHPPA